MDDPPFTTSDGGMIKPGYHETLDQYRDASKTASAGLPNLKQRSAKRPGLNH
ncbi:hypothetical protein NBRC111894_220 [Sporolactobacillus inulinus]|uniref:Uncharacterized protein n=1 Tax=Sporolactobacillus inulinus TaxID=2078 RepID=A0A4Y1Z6Y6_9BACL|nr:hypothetical protein NBRC111894_220 [Sporolactobacillus inulinus]